MYDNKIDKSENMSKQLSIFYSSVDTFTYVKKQSLNHKLLVKIWT